jgi:hypothetical protein
VAQPPEPMPPELASRRAIPVPLGFAVGGAAALVGLTRELGALHRRAVGQSSPGIETGVDGRNALRDPQLLRCLRRQQKSAVTND